MNQIDVFVSVGGTANEAQEAFVSAVEKRLRSEGLNPRTVGRNTFSSDAPLKAISEVLDTCSGTMVIALERSFFMSGVEKRGGPNQSDLTDIALPTSWNQIEAAMSYARGLPLMVIVDQGLKKEGLLEHGYDWYVQSIVPEISALHSDEFSGVLSDWKQRMIEGTADVSVSIDPSKLSVATLAGSLRPAQLWTVLVAISILVAGAFALGAKVAGAL